jgi:hypothetical protein
VFGYGHSYTSIPSPRKQAFYCPKTIREIMCRAAKQGGREVREHGYMLFAFGAMVWDKARKEKRNPRLSEKSGLSAYERH